MTDYITLSCPSCGGKLEITQDIERFACAHCGQEHIVKRGGGIVSLSPLVEGLKKVGIGVDKTAAELALERIPKELEALIAEKDNLLKESPYPEEYALIGLIIAFLIGCLLFVISLLVVIQNATAFVQNGDGEIWKSLVFGIPGIVLIIFAILPFINRNTKRLEVKRVWEEKTGVRIQALDQQIAIKQSELKRNKALVSQ